MSLIVDGFPKLRDPKIVVKEISKNFTFRGPFNKQHAKGDQTLLKSQSHHLCHICCSLWRQLICRKSLLLISKNLRVFLNIMTVDDKYFLLNRARLNFEHFQTTITFIPDVFPKLRTPKNVVKQISKNSTFRGSFEKQRVKGDETHLKSEGHHLYHIYWSLWRQLSWKNPLLAIWKFLRLFLHTLTANDK